MKNSHNYHRAKILFDAHQPTIVPHHCIQYEQNQSRDLGDMAGYGRTDRWMDNAHFKIPLLVEPVGDNK